MRNLIHKTLIISFAICLFLINNSLFSQPPRMAQERIMQMKKMKLLEILELNEKQSDKFLIKYTSWEKKLKAQNDKIDKLSDDLFKLLKDKGSESEIVKLSNEIMKQRATFAKLQTEKLKDFQSLLSKKNFANFLVFENRFLKELGRMMMRFRGGHGGKGMMRGR